MAIDMKVLEAATYGDPEAKIQLKRSWLKEVFKLLREGEQAKRELHALRKAVQQHNDMVVSDKDYHEGFDKLDKGMDTIFGKGGAFDSIFGRRKS